MRVAVVGGGIGGLAAANALWRRGIDVEVYEQAPELGEIGAGVLMTPNSLRALERMGMREALAAVGATISNGSSYYRADGTKIAPILTTDSSGWNGMYGMHRADLLAVLADALPSSRVHTGRRLVEFAQDESGCVLTFDDGSSATADVVVAADGIKSTLQHYVARPAQPINSGSVAYRGLVPIERIPSWRNTTSQLWMGDGKHFLVYPVRSGSMINYVAFVPSDSITDESWSAPGDIGALRDAFAGWDPLVGDLLACVDATYWWGLYDREPLETWTNGRLTLLGDAAHPMLPHLGQGANQAIEDGVALAVHLSSADPSSPEEALAAYEAQRRARTTAVQEGARANGRRYDSHFDDLSERDAEITASTSFRSWLYDYDVEQEAFELTANPSTVALGQGSCNG
ncbi:MAG TPA: FAD-dependent monooxygenase [Marisediminicola sp.]|jgi:salicylate hydroxylase|nr:FAD-dependent monooxygenase [Marisediminicola sp.]